MGLYRILLDYTRLYGTQAGPERTVPEYAGLRTIQAST